MSDGWSALYWSAVGHGPVDLSLLGSVFMHSAFSLILFNNAANLGAARHLFLKGGHLNTKYVLSWTDVHSGLRLSSVLIGSSCSMSPEASVHLLKKSLISWLYLLENNLPVFFLFLSIDWIGVSKKSCVHLDTWRSNWQWKWQTTPSVEKEEI